MLCMILSLFFAVGDQRAPARDLPQRVNLGTASISGVIVDAQGRALPQVRVQVNNDERVTYSDASGHFALPKLPAGSYQLSAQLPGYLTAAYAQRRPGKLGVALVLSEGEDRKDLKLVMSKSGVIGGHVLDQLGRPVVSATVMAMVLRWRPDGTREFSSSRLVQTDDRGEYRLFGLVPGEYVVVTIPQRVRPSARANGVDLDGIQQLTNQALVPTYYPNAPSPLGAVTIEIEADSERNGVDFNLTPVSLVRVRGRIIGSTVGAVSYRTGLADLGALILRDDLDVSGAALNGGDEREHVATISPDGRFVFEGVPPGQYSAFFNQGQGETARYAIASVAVADRDVSDLVINAQPGATLTGDQELIGASGKTSFPIVTVTALEGPLRLNNAVLQSKNDEFGKFTIAGLPPGKYLLSGLSVPSDWYLSSLHLGGIATASRVIEVGTADVTNVHLVYRQPVARLYGTLAKENAEPVTDYTLIVFPAERKDWPVWMIGATAMKPDSTGSFSKNLKPGNYLLVAVDDVSNNQWLDPKFLESLVPAAIKVSLSDGQKLMQNLTVK